MNRKYAIVMLITESKCFFTISFVSIILNILHYLHIVQYLQVICIQFLATNISNAYVYVLSFLRMTNLDKMMNKGELLLWWVQVDYQTRLYLYLL